MIIKEVTLRKIIRELFGLGSKKKTGGGSGGGGGGGSAGDWRGEDYRYGHAEIRDPEDEHSREGNYEDMHSEWEGDDDDGDDDDGDDD